MEVADRGQLISGGPGNDDLVQIVVSLTEATNAAVESEFDAYQTHLDSGNALVPFDLTTLGISLVGFERFERLLDFGSFRGIYVNPIVGSNSSQTLTGTAEADLIVGNGGNDSLIGLGGNDILIAGSENDAIDGGDDVYLFSGNSNGFDTFVDGLGIDTAIAVTTGTVIGVNGYVNGVEEFTGQGDTIIRDTNSSRTLNFSNTILTGIVEIDAAGGNDTITASNLSDGVYRGGSGNDRFVVAQSAGTVLIEITDFNDDGVDHIDLQALALPLGFADLQLSQDGPDVVVSVPAALNLRLIDALFEELEEDDFLF